MNREDLGRLFEVGFNIGVIACIQQKGLKHSYGSDYRQDLHQLKSGSLLNACVKGAASEDEKRILRESCLLQIQKGYLTGLHFLREYLALIRDRQFQVRYLQCSFSGANSLHTYVNEHQVEQFARQLGVNSIPRQYAERGEFLNADTLLLIESRKRFYLLCVDLSAFCQPSSVALGDPRDPEHIRSQLEAQNRYLRSKSGFAELKIDGCIQDFFIHEDFSQYYKAFVTQDKETAKLIQAGSYAESFWRFYNFESRPVQFNILGYSDRGLSSLTIDQQEVEILRTCAHIYKNKTQESPEVARDRVVSQIRYNAYRNFEGGREFIKSILDPNCNGTLTHTEVLRGFFNPCDTPSGYSQSLRDVHAGAIRDALSTDTQYLFLTGNPGIGKTTALVELLKDYDRRGEAFLLFYVSPRTQVNLDILKKFAIGSELFSDEVITLHTDASTIAANKGARTVKYNKNNRKGSFRLNTIDFQDAGDLENLQLRHRIPLQRTSEDTIRPKSIHTAGVMMSLCQAIHTVIDQDIARSIVATVAIQSFRINGSGDTLDHFKEIFKGATRDRGETAIDSKMQQIAAKIPHLVIMIDEITGDDAGVEFLNKIHKWLVRYNLFDRNKSGFDTRVVVADASVVAPDIINAHLESSNVEPTKIYFRRVGADDSKSTLPLTIQRFQFRKFQASVINTNAYPAAALKVTYRLYLESVNQNSQEKLSYLGNASQQAIVDDILSICRQSNHGQIIVYIQDKARLQELKATLRSTLSEFVENENYLEVHADLSEQQKLNIDCYKNQVQIVLMTASASRGISFPKTRHILVDVPRFEIERNLMEIIQVIYRGRGEDEIDRGEKELIFYLADRVYYNPEQPDISYQRQVLHTLNMLLLLKAAMMTRIYGYGAIGRQNFMVIPIGGKSVTSAGELLTNQINSFRQAVEKEYRRNLERTDLRDVAIAVQSLLNNVQMQVRLEENAYSYLQLQEFLAPNFVAFLQDGFDALLDLPLLEEAYVAGSLILVPARGLEETYRISFKEQIRKHITEKLKKQVYQISVNRNSSKALQAGARVVLNLIDELDTTQGKSQNLQQHSNQNDQYYAIPLSSLMVRDYLKLYFKEQGEQAEERPFRSILQAQVQANYPSDNFLPIGTNYQDIPFVVFRSFNLLEFRRKIFDRAYMLTSTEINLLGMILSAKDD